MFFQVYCWIHFFDQFPTRIQLFNIDDLWNILNSTQKVEYPLQITKRYSQTKKQVKNDLFYLTLN